MVAFRGGLARSTNSSTSDPVSTGMGDRLQADKPSRYVNSPSQLRLAVPAWVGAMSRPTGDDFGHPYR